MIANQFPEYRDARVEPLQTSGTDNAIFRIGLNAAARFPLHAMDAGECAEKLRAEAAAMVEFAECVPVATPRPIGLGRPGPHYPLPWSIQSWIYGAVATPDGLASSAHFAGEIADLVASLRRADPRDRRFDGQGRGGHLPDHDAWMETCLANSAGLLDVPRLRDLWRRLRALPPAAQEVMSHRDLIPANLLVHGERLVGVLDCGRFGPADPALDLVAAWHLLDCDRRAIVRSRLGSTDIEWKRGAAWAFEQAMGLVWYYAETNPTMTALGRSTLTRLLDDPELQTSGRSLR